MSSAAAEDVSEPRRLELRAPLFEGVVTTLAEDQRHVVLDLGVVRSGTVELFSQHRCRLDVMAMNAGEGSGLETLEPDEFKKRVVASIPPAKSEPVDLILCWNLFNYLSPEQIGIVVGELKRRCRAGSRLHALIEYSARTMPAVPLSFVPAMTGILEAEEGESEQVPAPRYSARDLEKCMPGFAHERTMLLGNGMQEYLFRHAGS